ncbi:MAG: Hsp33 family molecular chaperone HslO, partial [Pseudomonadota bacterium]
MSARAKATPDEAILPFQLHRANMRGRCVRLDTTLRDILAQHRYPPAVSSLVAESVILTALIGQAIELRWKFSLQVRGDGPIKLIATDYYAPEEASKPARMRAYAGFDAGDVASARQAPFEMLGKGVVGVSIDQGKGMMPYQGITPLTGSSLADCVETYFAQSEQLATRFAVQTAEAQVPGKAMHWRAGGIMIQQLPS